jgi:hypothetical protein
VFWDTIKGTPCRLTTFSVSQTCMPWLRPLIAGFLLWTVFQSHASPFANFFLPYSDPFIPNRFRCRGIVLRLITLSDTRTHAHAHTRTPTSAHTYTRARAHTHNTPTHMHEGARARTHKHTHTHKHSNAHTHTRAHTNVHTHIHRRASKHIHTHPHKLTHAHKPTRARARFHIHTHTHTLFWTGMGPSRRLLHVNKRHSQQTDRQTDVPPAGIELTIPSRVRPQAYALDLATTVIGSIRTL